MAALGTIAANANAVQSMQMGRTLVNTDASGLATIAFPTAFTAAPVVVCTSSNSDATYTFVIGTTAVTTTGFTVALRYLPSGAVFASSPHYVSWIACGPNTALGSIPADQLSMFPLQGASTVLTTAADGTGTITFPVAYGSAPSVVMSLGDSNSGAVAGVAENVATTTTFPVSARNTTGGAPIGSTGMRFHWLAANTADNLGDVGANQTFFTEMQASRDFLGTDATGLGTITFPTAFSVRPNVVAVQSNASGSGIWVINLVYSTSTTSVNFYVRDQSGAVANGALLYVSWVAWV